MQDGMAPPQVNLEDPRPGLEGLARLSTATSRDVRRALIIGTSPEGTLAALAIESV